MSQKQSVFEANLVIKTLNESKKDAQDKIDKSTDLVSIQSLKGVITGLDIAIKTVETIILKGGNLK